MNDVTTLPISPNAFWTIAALIGFGALSSLIYLALSQIVRNHRPPIWEELREGWQGPTVVLGLLWLGLFILTIAAAYVGVWKAIYPKGEASQPNLGLGALLAALLGAPFVIWATLIKRRTLLLSETALFNDKLNAAVTSLYARRQVTRPMKTNDEEKILSEWEDDIVQRSAAIDRLEGLVNERPDEAGRIVNMLTVYVREVSRQYSAQQSARARWHALVDSNDESPDIDDDEALNRLGLHPSDVTIEALEDWARGLRPFRTDVEKAVQTLGRLQSIASLSEEGIVFDLREANLQGFDLRDLYFAFANFSGAKMDGVNLVRAQLGGANFNDATMSGAYLNSAQMDGANLSFATLEGAVLKGARMEGVDLGFAKLAGADLSEAQISRSDLSWAHVSEATIWADTQLREAAVRAIDLSTTPISSEQVEATFGDGSTELPDSMPRPEHWPKAALDWQDFDAEWNKWRVDPKGYRPPVPDASAGKE